jgi:hypothetical protein
MKSCLAENFVAHGAGGGIGINGKDGVRHG